MRVQIKFVAFLSLLLLAPTLSFAAKKPRPPAVPGGAAVTVSKATKACFTDTLAMTGVLQPRSLVLVRPDQEGLQISQVKAEPGDVVTAGQALAQLARPDAQPGTAAATVSAPVAGTILRRSAIIGTTASARAQPLFEIIPKGELEVSAEVSAKDLARVAAWAEGEGQGHRRGRISRGGAAGFACGRSGDAARRGAGFRRRQSGLAHRRVRPRHRHTR